MDKAPLDEAIKHANPHHFRFRVIKLFYSHASFCICENTFNNLCIQEKVQHR